jgi:prepilin-type processing-associated H-X9-DG protein/prepilin-type N-terminal cleavage/methylation domain-containing protein
MTTLPETRNAFTLVELLAVIAIIGVLAGLSVVVIGKARESSRSAACLGQLRDIAGAAQLYPTDHKGVLIPICSGTSVTDAKTWRIHLQSYIGVAPAALHCPSDPVDPTPENDRGLRPTSYGINKSNGLHEYFGANAQKRTVQIVNPANTIFMSDIAQVANPGASVTQWTSTESANAGNFGYARFPNDPSFSGGDPWNIFPRHKGRANVAFYDGHVASVDIDRDIIAPPPGDPLCIYDNN